MIARRRREAERYECYVACLTPLLQVERDWEVKEGDLAEIDYLATDVPNFQQAFVLFNSLFEQFSRMAFHPDLFKSGRIHE